MATGAMNSRLFGGIYFPFTYITGFNMGNAIGRRATTDGSPQRPNLPGGPPAYCIGDDP